MRSIENHVMTNGTKVELFIVEMPMTTYADVTIEASYYSGRSIREDKAVIVTGASGDEPQVQVRDMLDLDLLRFILDKVADWRERQKKAVTPE